MLIFNPKRMIVMREISKAHSALVKIGFAPATATNLLNYHIVRVSVEHIEKMCVMLCCTPNDLFDWRENTNAPLPENHPLHSLKREKKISNLREMIKDMPVEKLEQLETVIAELKNQ